MRYKRLYIWVEGDDDIRFFERIAKPLLREKYDCVEIRPYAKMTVKSRNNYLKGIKGMGADYIYVADVGSAPCVRAKKGEIRSILREIDENRVLVVIKVIESWYLAGLSSRDVKKLRIPPFKNTNDITKRQFNDIVPNKFDSRIDFMVEILKRFSVEIAKQKNLSFRYFIGKHN